jgi:single-stranded-DNA-specific exonuclease
MLTSVQKEILKKRGFDEVEMEAFVEAKVDDLKNPLLLSGMDNAAGLIELAIQNEERICLVGDFDADGITSTVLMLLALKELGAKHVFWYINSRFEFGYGLQTGSLQDILYKYGQVDLIITVDNGITAMAAIAEAKRLGIKVLVTDHHEPAETLPAADCIINPKQEGCSFPDKNLAGVGVAFKLIQYLFQIRNIPRKALLYLDLVAIGTVADVMSLTGENRIIVKNGLKLMNWVKARQGIKAIKKVFNIHGEISAYHLGFCFGPLLNAQGRIDGVPATAIEILTTNDPARAAVCAQELYALNKERQEITERQVQQTLQRIGTHSKKFVVYFDENIHEGIAGLIAGRVKEHYYVPTLILTKDERTPGVAKGSARSVEGFNMKLHLIDECGDLLVKGGGHAMAAGISVKIEDIPELTRRLETVAAQFPDDMFQSKLDIDYNLPAEDINLDLVEQIQGLAPFGVGFPTPVLKMTDFLIKNSTCFGKDEKHLKLIGSRGLELLLFGKGAALPQARQLKMIDIAGTLAKNEWNGYVKIQFTAKEDRIFA